MTKERIHELDYLRFFAFFAVISQHVLGFYQRNSIFSAFDNAFVGVTFGMVKFAVPLFVFLSGVVLFHHYYESLNYGRFLTKRFLTIYVPYILWSVFYLIYPYKTLQDIDAEWFKALPEHLLYGSGKYHLWYVAMIVQIFILLPLLIFLFKKVSGYIKTTRSFLLVMLLSLVFYLLYIGYYLKLLTHFDNPDINNFFYMMYSRGFLSYSIYFLLGALVARYYESWVGFLKKYQLIIYSVTALSYLYCTVLAFHGSSDTINLNLYGSLNFKMLLLTLSSIMTLYLMALCLQKKFGHIKWIQFSSKYSYGGYLAHGLVLGEVYQQLLPLGLNVTVFYGLVLLLTTLLSLLIGAGFQILFGKLIQTRNKRTKVLNL